MKDKLKFLVIVLLSVSALFLYGNISYALEKEEINREIEQLSRDDPQLAEAVKRELQEAIKSGEVVIDAPEPEKDALERLNEQRGALLKEGFTQRGLPDRARDFSGKADDQVIGDEDREDIKREFKNEVGRQMTADEEKQIFEREDDGKYHGTNRDYAIEIAGREHERAAREYSGRDSSREIDYDREAAQRELEANSREREYGREVPESSYERDISRETDYDREAAERERAANNMEGY